MKTEQDIKNMLQGMGSLSVLGSSESGKKWKGKCGVYVYAGKKTTQGLSGVDKHADDDKRIILRMTFSVWHSGRQKWIRAYQWNTRTTQDCVTETRLQRFINAAKEHGNKRAENFSEEHYEWVRQAYADLRKRMRAGN